jgi:predicted enzyme related to lactoylglutathione lyase
MAIEGVYATIYYVDDWDASVQFYRDVLGLKARHVERGWAEFGVGKNGTVALHEREGDHPGVEVSLLVSDIEKTLVELEAGGARLVQPIRRQDFGAVATVADPSGNLIGLYEPPGGGR